MKDLKRTFYIVAIVALAFLLVIEWSQFKKEQAADKALANKENATSTQMNDGADRATSTSSLTQSGKATAKTIAVHTDVLNVDISTKGGDIIGATLKQHDTRLNDDSEPYVLLHKKNDRVYTAPSGLIGADGIDSKGRPTYTIEGDDFTLEEGKDTLSIDLTYQANQVSYIKRFTFTRGDYLVKVQYLIDNRSDRVWQGKFYASINRDGLVPFNYESPGGMGLQPYLGAAITTNETNYKKIDFEDIDDAIADGLGGFKESVQGGWLAMIQHYFISAWIPSKNTLNEYNLTRNKNNPELYELSAKTPLVTIERGEQGSIGMGFYVGPKDIHRLEEISENLDLTIDFGWLWWIAKPLFYALSFIHSFVNNWGIAIILLTVCIKLLFFPLSAASYRSMAKMRKLGPQMKTLKERFGEDRQKMSQEMMKLYKKEKVNPLGGCFPILIQMPVFIALYYVLMESVELRHAPFALWLQDLSTMDPYYILPLIMGATMYIQQQLNPTPPDPTQAKIMKWMPVVFTLMFLWFPSGLVLYWVVNNTLSIIQQYVITKRIEAQG